MKHLFPNMSLKTNAASLYFLFTPEVLVKTFSDKKV
jgi:hypothetical protein